MIKENLSEEKQNQYDQLINDLESYNNIIKKTEIELKAFEEAPENNIYNSFEEAEIELSEYYIEEAMDYIDNHSICELRRSFPTKIKQEFFICGVKYLGTINICFSDLYGEPMITSSFSYEAVNDTGA